MLSWPPKYSPKADPIKEIEPVMRGASSAPVEFDLGIPIVIIVRIVIKLLPWFVS